MLLIRDIILFFVIAAGAGLGSAYFAVNHSQSLELFVVGPWKSWPNAAGPSANPYSKADQARKGSLLIGSGEGLSFTATTDDAGTPLDGACQYRIRGTHLPARMWTLTLMTLDGHLVDNPSERYSFHSRNIARVAGSEYEIVTGPQALGGDWLKSEADVPFKLVLRLYETPLNSGGGFGSIELPEISWVGCQ